MQKQYYLLITQCPDLSMWYAGKVGHLVPFCGAWNDSWRSREDAGLINIVHFKDAVLVEGGVGEVKRPACPAMPEKTVPYPDYAEHHKELTE